jgi:hypothetical protein
MENPSLDGSTHAAHSKVDVALTWVTSIGHSFILYGYSSL